MGNSPVYRLLLCTVYETCVTWLLYTLWYNLARVLRLRPVLFKVRRTLEVRRTYQYGRLMTLA